VGQGERGEEGLGEGWAGHGRLLLYAISYKNDIATNKVERWSKEINRR
jgi:hypothetical protein